MKPGAWATISLSACLIAAATGAQADNICSSGYATGGGWLIEDDTPGSSYPRSDIVKGHKATTPVTADRQSQQSAAGTGKIVAIDRIPLLPE